MIDPRTKLTLIHDEGAFTDRTDDGADFIRDEFTMALSDTGYIYIGLYKPFGACYAEFNTPNINTNSLSMEYYDGTSWVSGEIDDETKGFTRSGFLFWDKSSMSALAVDGKEKFYIRLQPDVAQSAAVIRAINLVFADDNSLKQEFFEMDHASILPPGETSHITTHSASRDFIVQRLRNQGYIKQDADGLENITQFDLLDTFEVRQSAVYLALSKIFFNLSDNPEDHWWAKYNQYQDKFEEMFKMATLSMDLDDDGADDINEKLAPRKTMRFVR